VELRVKASAAPISGVTLETIRTVLDQAEIAIRNSLNAGSH